MWESLEHVPVLWEESVGESELEGKEREGLLYIQQCPGEQRMQ